MRFNTTAKLTSTILITASLFLVAAGFTGCGPQDKSGTGESTAKESSEQATRIAVIPKGTTHSFWKAVHAGARKAEKELSESATVEIIWKGPLQEDQRDSQISVVENFIGQQVNGIVLAPLDAKALVSPVKQAESVGIPVVIIDSGLDHDGIVSFCATDNFEGGRLAGEHLAKLIGEKGKVLMLRYQVGSASTERREAGFLDAIAQYPDIEVVSDNQYAGPTRDTAFTAAQNLLNRNGSDIDGVFASNESATNGMLLALRESNKAGGSVKFVGFDGGETNLNALQAGDIQGLILQDPFNMGYLGVMTLARHLAGESVEPRIDTGARLVTKENFDDPDIQDLIAPPLDKYLSE